MSVIKRCSGLPTVTSSLSYAFSYSSFPSSYKLAFINPRPFKLLATFFNSLICQPVISLSPSCVQDFHVLNIHPSSKFPALIFRVCPQGFLTFCP